MCWQDVEIARSIETARFGSQATNGTADTAMPADPQRVALTLMSPGPVVVTFLSPLSLSGGAAQRFASVILTDGEGRTVTIQELGSIITLPYYITDTTGLLEGAVMESALPRTVPSGRNVGSNWPGK